MSRAVRYNFRWNRRQHIRMSARSFGPERSLFFVMEPWTPPIVNLHGSISYYAPQRIARVRRRLQGVDKRACLRDILGRILDPRLFRTAGVDRRLGKGEPKILHALHEWASPGSAAPGSTVTTRSPAVHPGMSVSGQAETAAAVELGVELSESDAQRQQIGMSGRKGLGVKADDLIDRLEENALKEVQSRHQELTVDEQRLIAHQIAIAALRYFLLKFTRTSIIAFDFNEALSFNRNFTEAATAKTLVETGEFVAPA